MFAPPMTITVFPAAAARACSSALSMPSVTNVYEVPPSRFSLAADRWETTKHGAWNVGLSPQGPTPTSNTRRPITSAPTFAKDSTSNASASSGVLPENIHSWSLSPPSPSGRSTSTFGPATKPSRDTDNSTSTLPSGTAPPPDDNLGSPRVGINQTASYALPMS